MLVPHTVERKSDSGDLIMGEGRVKVLMNEERDWVVVTETNRNNEVIVGLGLFTGHKDESFSSGPLLKLLYPQAFTLGLHLPAGTHGMFWVFPKWKRKTKTNHGLSQCACCCCF